MVQVMLLCYTMPFVFSLSDLILDQDLYTPKLVYALLVVILAYCASFCVRSNIVNENGYAIPPGPLLRYASLGKYPQRALRVWAQKYGPLFSLFVGDQLFMVISDPQTAHDLLVKNGKIFSSRKEYFIKAKTILRGRAITSTPYGDTWQADTLLDPQLFWIQANPALGESIAGLLCCVSIPKQWEHACWLWTTKRLTSCDRCFSIPEVDPRLRTPFNMPHVLCSS